MPLDREEVIHMTKFMDQHPMTPFSAEQLREAQRAPKDEFGVTHHDIIYSEKDNKIWCVLNAPDRDAVEKHHAKLGIECEWIHHVASSRD